MFTTVFAFVFIYVILLFAGFVGNRLKDYKAIRGVDLIDLFDAVDEIMSKPIYHQPQSLGAAALDFDSMSVRELRDHCKGVDKYKGYSKVCSSRKQLVAHIKMCDMIARGFDPIVAFECRFD